MILALFVLVAPTDVPDVVALSAVLEEGGVPVDRRVAASFVLWDAADGGNAVWSDAEPALDVRDGLLVVELGAGRPLPPNVFQQRLWLEIAVDGQALAPRNRLASAPYALEAAHAQEAATLAGLGPDDVATVAALRTPGAIEVSFANIVDAPAGSDDGGVDVYANAFPCQLQGALVLSSTCLTRACAGGALDCSGTCINGATLQTCPNVVVGRMHPP